MRRMGWYSFKVKTGQCVLLLTKGVSLSACLKGNFQGFWSLARCTSLPLLLPLQGTNLDPCHFGEFPETFVQRSPQ